MHKPTMNLFYATLVALIFSWHSDPAAATTRNILLIIADDFGVDVAGFYPTSAGRLVTNPPAPPTPNLTRLARRGIVFRDAWADMECSPTRATILTGRYGFRTGIGAYLRPGYPTLPLTEFTLPEAFKARPGLGYQLANIGKWNLSYGYSDPNLQGWSYFAGDLPGAGALEDYFSWPKVVNGTKSRSTVYATTDQVNEAVAAIQRAKTQSKPYLLWLAFNAPHIPYHKPPNALHSYDSLPPYIEGLPPRPYYEAMVEAMDTEIGRLLQSVDLATTTVIFLGDNGTPGAVIAPPYSRAKGKSTITEGGIRVPLLIAGAGVAAPGRVVNGIVNTVDLFPTILELAGISPKAVLPPGIRMDGTSLMPYITDPNSKALRAWTYSEKFALTYNDDFVRAIRDATFKLIRRYNGNRQFFNLVTDPRENTNLLGRQLTAIERSHFDVLGQRLDALLATR